MRDCAPVGDVTTARIFIIHFGRPSVLRPAFFHSYHFRPAFRTPPCKYFLSLFCNDRVITQDAVKASFVGLSDARVIATRLSRRARISSAESLDFSCNYNQHRFVRCEWNVRVDVAHRRTQQCLNCRRGLPTERRAVPFST